MTAELELRSASGTQRLAGKYLTFSIQHESYGIDVLQVREIIRTTDITAVPQTPSYMRGVINLRGKIIPVMDLRLRFGFAGIQDSEPTCIVVVLVNLLDGRTTQMGLIVDGVEEVTNIAATDIEETPEFGVEIAGDHILGMAKVKGAVKMLLNISSVLTTLTAQIATTTPIEAAKS